VGMGLGRGGGGGVKIQNMVVLLCSESLHSYLCNAIQSVPATSILNQNSLWSSFYLNVW